MSDEWFHRFQYPNGTLKNKFDIQNHDQLQKLEYEESAQNALALLQIRPDIKDISSLENIHKVLFGEIYSWAGEYREYDLHKGTTTFLEPNFFEMAAYAINESLKKLYHVNNVKIREYADLTDKLNNLHPFREGNGRSARLFLQIFAANNGDYLNYSRNDSEMIKALSNANIDKIASMLKLSKFGSPEKAFDEIIINRMNELQNANEAKYDDPNIGSK